jgi:hypothetical protein
MKLQRRLTLGMITLLFSCSEMKTEQIEPIDKTLKLDYLYQDVFKDSTKSLSLTYSNNTTFKI